MESTAYCFIALLLLVCSAAIADLPPSVVGGSHSAANGATVTKHGKNVVCYVSSWAVYRPGKGSFDMEQLEPGLGGCSHLVYAFAGLNASSSSIRSLDPFRDLSENYGKGTYRRMTGLRRRYPHLKVTLAVGGWNEGSANYSAMASAPQLRKQFVQSALEFIQTYDFDGLDLDWEYPGKRGGKPEDKKNFVALVRELREAFDGRGWILTSAIGAGKDTLEVAYDVRALSPHLDLFHLMCYDYHGAWDSRTGHNAPLHHYPEGKQENDKYHTTEYSVNYLLDLGAPPRKVVMGVPMYGRTLLVDREDPLVEDKLIPPGFPAKDKGFPGPFTKEDGFMGYNEICLELMNSEKLMENGSSDKWIIGWDDASKTPYASRKDKWITYDDERSIQEKVKFAMEKELGGIMVWAIDTDDFHGDCSSTSEAGFKKFPLLNAINKAIIQAIEDKENVIPDDKHAEKPGSSASILSIPTVIVAIISLVMPILNQ